MTAALRIATFNLESLDDRDDGGPTLDERIALLRPALRRLGADILCLQEVNAQRTRKGEPRELAALARLLDGTPYEDFHRHATMRADGKALADKHNLVALSRWPFIDVREFRHEFVSPPLWQARTGEQAPSAVGWDRPIQYVTIDLGAGRSLHLINLHLRAPLATAIPGQKVAPFVWKSVEAWAEGYFLSALKRTGQALEARLLIDRIFDLERDARLVVLGDFNAEIDESPLKIVRGAEEDTGNGRLAWRALVPLERGLPEGRRYSVIHHGRRIMLDHILVSRAMTAGYRAIEVHNEMLGDELVGYVDIVDDPESYHAPVVAEFDLDNL